MPNLRRLVGSCKDLYIQLGGGKISARIELEDLNSPKTERKYFAITENKEIIDFFVSKARFKDGVLVLKDYSYRRV